MSDRVLLLNHGQQLYYGDKHEACKLYYDSDKLIPLSAKETNVNKEKKIDISKENNILENKEQIIHRDGGSIESLQIIDENDKYTMQVEMTKKLRFVIGYKVEKILDNPAIAISFKNSKNMLITTIVYDLEYDKKFMEIEIPFMFEAGEYSFDMNIGNLTGSNSGVFISEYKDLPPIAVIFDYQNRAPILGVVGLDTKMRFL